MYLAPAGFLARIAPAHGYTLAMRQYRVTLRRTGEEITRHDHFGAPRPSQAEEWLLGFAEQHKQTCDLYMTPATFRTRLGGVKPDGKRMSTRRLTCVHRLQAVWLDIDLKTLPDHHANAASLLPALRAFIAAVGTPPVEAVHSGGGVHLYWRLPDPLTLEQWVPVASAFSQLATAHDVRHDPQCTVDAVRVLRVPQTWNYKRLPVRPVRRIAWPDTDYTTAQPLDIQRLGALPAVRRPAATHTPSKLMQGARKRGWLVDTPLAPVALFSVLRQCQALGYWAVYQADQTEAGWLALLSTCAHTHEGRKGAHAVSRQYPSYSVAETDAKYAHAQSLAPFSCATIERYGGRCQGCPHHGLHRHPLVFAREYEALRQLSPPALPPAERLPVAQETPPVTTTTAEVLVEQLPAAVDYIDTLALEHGLSTLKHFHVSAAGVYVLSKDKGATEARWILITPAVLMPMALVEDAGQGAKFMRFVLVAGGAPRTLWVDTRKLTDRRTLLDALHGMVPCAASQYLRLHEFFSVCFEVLQFCPDRVLLYDLTFQQGWSADSTSFVLGDTQIMRTGERGGRIRRRPLVGPDAELSRHTVQKGSLDAWRQQVSMYEGYTGPFVLPLLASFASPLLRFSEYKGAFLAIEGETGAGKTPHLTFAQSVWYDPEWRPMKATDSYKSRIRLLGAMGSVPVFFDEMTEVDPAELKRLLLDITQGATGSRMHQDGETMRRTYRWDTLVVAASNNPVHESLRTLATAMSGATAAIARALSVTVTQGDRNRISAERLTEVRHSIQNNYGVAGEAFILAVMRFTELELKQRIAFIRQQLLNSSVYTHLTRIYFNLIACMWVAGEIASDAGLIGFAYQDALKTLAARVVAYEEEMQGAAHDPGSVMSSILQRLSGSMLIAENTAEAMERNANYRGEIKLVRHPDYYVMTQRTFRDLCVESRWNTADILRTLTGVATLQTQRLWPGLPRARCLLINRRHALFTKEGDNMDSGDIYAN